MASFEIIAGDFGDHKRGQVLTGKLVRPTAQGLYLPITGQSFKTEQIGRGQIAVLEIATEENLKKMTGAVGWGLVGGLALGPVGALAGVLKGGNSKEISFICQLKDGRKFLGRCDAKTYTELQAVRFENPVLSTGPSKKPPVIPALVGLALLIVVLAVVLGIRSTNHAKGVTAQSADTTINRPALKLTVDMLMQDVDSVLLHDAGTFTGTPTEHLMGWVRLDWKLTATQYEADYDRNEVAADNEFKGKKILITSAVASIEKDFKGDPFVTLATGSLMGVHAQLNESAAGTASLLRKGQKINLVCDGGGRVVTIASLTNCEPAKDYFARLRPSVDSRLVDFLNGKLPLHRPVAEPVLLLYILGSSLPADSPCITGNGDCHRQLDALLSDKAKAQAVHDQMSRLSASLKVN